MSRYRHSKVVWHEGMLLAPHHFQQWDNYHEELLTRRLRPLTAYGWGVLDLQTDREKAANGTFRVTMYRAVMPDGLPVNMPESDPEPEPRPLAEHFRLTDEHLDVYLAVPAARLGAADFETAYAGNGHPSMARFRQETAQVLDETTGDNAQPLTFARGNFRLLFGDEPRGGYETVKLAEVRRTVTGQFRITERYVPPALDLAASPWLVGKLRDLIEILTTRSGSLAEQRRQTQTGLADFSTSNVGLFWLLHTINTALPALVHLWRTTPVHPERLYDELIRLAGALMTFAANRHPKEIVAYEHENLTHTFSQLFAELMELLQIVIPDKCVPIILKEVRPTIYGGTIEDARLLQDATFYLGVRAELDAEQLIKDARKLIKIAAGDDIDAVIGAALPGVPLLHASSPPAALHVHERFQYFWLEPHSPYWTTITGSKQIAVHVPDSFPDVRLELYAVKP